MYRTRYSCQILMKLEFSDRFSKNTQMSNFIKFRPVGAELFHVDRQADGKTEMTNLIVAQHFNIQLMHTTLKNVGLLKHFKISKSAPTCFG